MNTMAMPAASGSHRKLIDIPEDVFKVLSMKSAAAGVNLKKYIEQLLIEDAADVDDAAAYLYLSATRPEGKQMLDSRETADFEKWLDANRK